MILDELLMLYPGPEKQWCGALRLPAPYGIFARKREEPKKNATFRRMVEGGAIAKTVPWKPVGDPCPAFSFLPRVVPFNIVRRYSGTELAVGSAVLERPCCDLALSAGALLFDQYFVAGRFRISMRLHQIAKILSARRAG